MHRWIATGALALAAGCGGGATGDAATQALTIKGSDTMVHLVTSWAEAYMEAHPEAQITVTGGGSGTGIAAMLNGTTTLCMASRDVKPKEVELAKTKGITFGEHVVARDAIAVIAHPGHPVHELSMDQLRQIFNGTLTNWSQVGGPDQPIQALSRESNSGTYVFFNEHVCQKDDFGARVRLMPSNAAIVQSVTQDAGSVGYVGLGYATQGNVALIGVRANADGPAVTPSAASVADGSYGIARPLYLYTNGEATGLAKAFIDFAVSDAGQKIVTESGYVPLR